MKSLIERALSIKPYIFSKNESATVVDTKMFNVLDKVNRRFMYNPDTGTLVLGDSDIGGAKVVSSHANEFDVSGAQGNFDDYIRGWVGAGGDYKNGVIHFAPIITAEMYNDIKLKEKVLLSVEFFIKHGANKKTILRGVIDRGDVELGKSRFRHLLDLKESRGSCVINEMPWVDVKDQTIDFELEKAKSKEDAVSRILDVVSHINTLERKAVIDKLFTVYPSVLKKFGISREEVDK